MERAPRSFTNRPDPLSASNGFHHSVLLWQAARKLVREVGVKPTIRASKTRMLSLHYSLKWTRCLSSRLQLLAEVSMAHPLWLAGIEPA